MTGDIVTTVQMSPVLEKDILAILFDSLKEHEELVGRLSKFEPFMKQNKAIAQCVVNALCEMYTVSIFKLICF